MGLLRRSTSPRNAVELDDDVYVVRRNRKASRPAQPILELRILGDEPQVRLDGTAVHLRPRHIEMLAILALHRGHLNADVMCAELYGDDGHPSSIRVEMSRLRRQLPDMLQSGGYRLIGTVDSDVRKVRALLPDSVAPGIEREREELDGWLRQAVITSEDADALWAWVRSPSGANDLLAAVLAELKETNSRRLDEIARELQSLNEKVGKLPFTG